jgi:hypothetical protein
MLNKEKEWLRKRCSDNWKKWSFRNTVRGLLPITEWLPKYKLKKDLPADIAAGLTLGIMNIPQGKCMYVPLSVSKQITPLGIYRVNNTKFGLHSRAFQNHNSDS